MGLFIAINPKIKECSPQDRLKPTPAHPGCMGEQFQIAVQVGSWAIHSSWNAL